MIDSAVRRTAPPIKDRIDRNVVLAESLTAGTNTLIEPWTNEMRAPSRGQHGGVGGGAGTQWAHDRPGQDMV